MADASQGLRQGFTGSFPAHTRQIITPVRLIHACKPGEALVPCEEQVNALWDTGAQSSTISNAIAQKLGLPVIGESWMKGAGGSYKAEEYLAGLGLPNGLVIREMSLYGFHGGGNLDMLIGMDVIGLGDFLVCTHNGTTYVSFQFPSIGPLYLRDIKHAWLQDGREVRTTPATVRRAQARIGRNAPCPCGSGKKYKACCGKPLDVA